MIKKNLSLSPRSLAAVTGGFDENFPCGNIPRILFPKPFPPIPVGPQPIPGIPVLPGGGLLFKP